MRANVLIVLLFSVVPTLARLNLSQNKFNIWAALSKGRVGPKHEKLSDQAPNWNKVVPWIIYRSDLAMTIDFA